MEQYKKLGEIESVKAVSDIFAPIGGQVVEVNQAVVDHPEVVNEDPFDGGWLVKVMSDDAEKDMESLMSAREYETFLESEAH